MVASEYLRAAVTVVDTEEVDGGDLLGGSRSSGRTATDVITRAGHEPRHNSHGVLHLSPPPNHRSEPPGHTLVVSPHTLLSRRRCHSCRLPSGSTAVVGGRRILHPRNHGLRHNCSEKLPGAAAGNGYVAAGASSATRVFGSEYGRSAGAG